MNICQRVNRLEENIERISEVLDGFIENANYNSSVNNVNVIKIAEKFEQVFEELDELRAVPDKH
ncbi:hypothetical protein SK629_0823 [Streptococcus mitis]|uniref:Uncharacterized protein n=1 Tax=Streptococcus mitis TaxID=28037 RepID=A0A081PX92_STRMT|nr:hypothetical protein [Streptococcus mitis]KEQ35315.1 hypothetical protein SK629_0823 [Streptococcus mitis]